MILLDQNHLGPISCGDNGWYCRIFDDEENGWPSINLPGDVNFGSCNTTDPLVDMDLIKMVTVMVHHMIIPTIG